MVNSEKKSDIEKYKEKKSYCQPQLEKIGRMNQITKGGTGLKSVDNNWPHDIFDFFS